MLPLPCEAGRPGARHSGGRQRARPTFAGAEQKRRNRRGADEDIAQHLEQRIRDQSVAPGDQLPSERDLMREFGVEPERTLMIGDTTHDLQMAANAGCASVGVSYGAHAVDGFEALRFAQPYLDGAFALARGATGILLDLRANGGK